MSDMAVCAKRFRGAFANSCSKSHIEVVVSMNDTMCVPLPEHVVFWTSFQQHAALVSALTFGNHRRHSSMTVLTSCAHVNDGLAHRAARLQTW